VAVLALDPLLGIGARPPFFVGILKGFSIDGVFLAVLMTGPAEFRPLKGEGPSDAAMGPLGRAGAKGLAEAWRAKVLVASHVTPGAEEPLPVQALLKEGILGNDPLFSPKPRLLFSEGGVAGRALQGLLGRILEQVDELTHDAGPHALCVEALLPVLELRRMTGTAQAGLEGGLGRGVISWGGPWGGMGNCQCPWRKISGSSQGFESLRGASPKRATPATRRTKETKTPLAGNVRDPILG
jgi:hypothetical protein